jgi:hypothetical protein
MRTGVPSGSTGDGGRAKIDVADFVEDRYMASLGIALPQECHQGVGAIAGIDSTNGAPAVRTSCQNRRAAWRRPDSTFLRNAKMRGLALASVSVCVGSARKRQGMSGLVARLRDEAVSETACRRAVRLWEVRPDIAGEGWMAAWFDITGAAQETGASILHSYLHSYFAGAGAAGSIFRIAEMRQPSAPRVTTSVVHILRFWPPAKPVRS